MSEVEKPKLNLKALQKPSWAEVVSENSSAARFLTHFRTKYCTCWNSHNYSKRKNFSVRDKKKCPSCGTLNIKCSKKLWRDRNSLTIKRWNFDAHLNVNLWGNFVWIEWGMIAENISPPSLNIWSLISWNTNQPIPEASSLIQESPLWRNSRSQKGNQKYWLSTISKLRIWV